MLKTWGKTIAWLAERKWISTETWEKLWTLGHTVTGKLRGRTRWTISWADVEETDPGIGIKLVGVCYVPNSGIAISFGRYGLTIKPRKEKK